MKIGLLVLIWLFCMTGCSTENDGIHSGDTEQTAITFAVSNDMNIENAVVMFFRDLPDVDTLVYQTVINGLTDQNNRFQFTLPAGYFQMVLLGNIDTVAIGHSGDTLTSQNIIIEYPDGLQPKDLFYGRIKINSGENNKMLFSGLLRLNVRVALTVRDVPVNVKKIVSKLRNTSVGIRLQPLNELNKIANVADSLDNIAPGSSPVFEFSGFPTVPDVGGSFVDVFCYDGNDHLVFSGSSSSFSMGGFEAISVSCSFAGAKKSLHSLPDNINQEYKFYLYSRTD